MKFNFKNIALAWGMTFFMLIVWSAIGINRDIILAFVPVVFMSTLFT